MNISNVIVAFLNFCTLNSIQPDESAYKNFAVSRCTSCGTMREELNTPCAHCGVDQGEGFLFSDIIV